MEITGQVVYHKKYETGVVIEQTEEQVTVAFNTCELKFLYPAAFKQFLVLVDTKLQERLIEEINEESRKVIALNEKRTVTTRQITPIQKKKKARVERPNIAFKCNYCDGGKSSSTIGFNGVCSDRVLVNNIEIEKRTWCCSEDSPCFSYLCGDLTRAQLEAEFKYSGYVCYESQMLREWKAMAGIVQKGERKGQPMRLKNVQTGSLCVLTTRLPESIEAERIIFAVFLVDESYDGDNYEEGFVSTKSKYKISLSLREAEKMLFWRYHVNENNPEKEAWNSGLHRYLTDSEAVQILRDIAQIKKNTKDAELANEFLSTFTRMVGIDAEEVGNPKGVLATK